MDTIWIQNGYKMDTISSNSKNSGTSDTHRSLLNLTDKINLKRSENYVALSKLSIYYTCKKIKKSYKKNAFKKSPPTRFVLPDESYSVSDIQHYLEYM